MRRKVQIVAIVSALIVGLSVLSVLNSIRLGAVSCDVNRILSNSDNIQRSYDYKNHTTKVARREVPLLDLLHAYDHLTLGYEKFDPDQVRLIDVLHNYTADLPEGYNFSSLYWQFALRISSSGLYSERDGETIDEMLATMSTSNINVLIQGDGGTQLKFFVMTDDSGRSIVKIKKVDRNYQVPPDLYYFSEFERHHAEIAAYHLDRVLGFNRSTPDYLNSGGASQEVQIIEPSNNGEEQQYYTTWRAQNQTSNNRSTNNRELTVLVQVPPCVGRILNITQHIEPFANYSNIRIFTSMAGNRCVNGNCKYFCDTAHSACGSPDLVEVSMCAFLPFSTFPSDSIASPWARSYSTKEVADWENAELNSSYCSMARQVEATLRSDRRLLDVIDLYIFDFLTGNMDRHDYDSFLPLGKHSAVIAIDNGRAFGRPYKDDMSILAPLYQCCFIRNATYEKLAFVADGNVSLSDLMLHSLAKDPLHQREPLLTEAQLKALDRRVQLILDVVHSECIKKRALRPDKVIIDEFVRPRRRTV